MAHLVRALAFLLFVALMSSAPAAGASIYQGDVVSEDPENYTPQLVDTGSGPKPRVDTIEQLGETIYAGGLFSKVVDSADIQHNRFNIMAFGAVDGVLSPTFSPVIDGNVWAVEAADNSVYVGGAFKTINGVSRPALAKLDAVTGAVDPNFDAPFNGGQITEIDLVDGQLIVGGSPGTKLMALNPATGQNTRFINLGIKDAIPGARGGVSVFRFAVDPAGETLVATGNFETVSGQPRKRLFVVDLTGSKATLDPWYYEPFSWDCASEHPRRIAYLQGVDFSPDGSYFAVTATGQIVDRAADKDVTVCDAVGRFDMDNDDKPVWINYTGGDSVWSVAATGAAVYVQGHFKYLDNKDGYGGHPDLTTAVKRLGIGAVDSVSGNALPWNPPKPAQIGGKDFLATSTGLWVGSDSAKFSGEYHRGIAFVPLPQP